MRRDAEGVPDPKIEQLCSVIVKKSSDNWDERNRAMNEMTAYVRSMNDGPAKRAEERFNTNTLKLLVEPIKSFLTDPRSQQVRDVCLFLSQLAETLHDHMAFLLRDTFAFVLDGLKVTNKVMASFVHDCIIVLIKNVTYKGSISLLLQEIRSNKAKYVREKCMEYISLILGGWELSDKSVDLCSEAVKIGLQDASVIAREAAKVAYLNLLEHWPLKAEKLKSEIPPSIKPRLIKAEEEHLLSVDSLRTGQEALPTGRDIVLSDDRRLSVRMKPITVQENAVTAIQAAFRGSMVRKLSPPRSELKSSGITAIDTRGPTRPLVIIPESPPASPSNKNKPPLSPPSSSRIPRSPKSHVNVPSDNVDRGRHVFGDASKSSLLKASPSTTSKRPPVEMAKNKSASVVETSPAVPRVKMNSSSTYTPTNVKVPVENSSNFVNPPANLRTGMKVFVDLRDKQKVIPGTVRFIGRTLFQKGYWVGVELNSPMGDTNGALRGHAYFSCRPNHGVFVRADAVTTTPPDVEYCDIVIQSNEPTSSSSTLRPNSKVKSLSDLLKWKLTRMMDVLNQELEAIEFLEADMDNDGTLESLSFDVVQMLNVTSSNETKILNEFRACLSDLLGKES